MTATKDALPQPQVRAAEECLVQARQSRVTFRDYGNVVRQLPSLLQRHGLGLTLAYLQMRGGGNQNSPYELVSAQLNRWLVQALGLSARAALPVLCTRDSRFYLEAASQAILFAHALCTRVAEEQP